MHNKSINWNIFPKGIKDRFKNDLTRNDIYKTFKSLNWETVETTNTISYKNFLHSINELQLTLNLYDNFYLIIDNSQQNGLTTFGIDIPEEYFRFPHLNNGLIDIPLEEEERIKIREVISYAKEKQRIKNDGSITEEHLARFEFLITFQLLEGFLEEYLVELDVSNGIDEETSRKNRNKEVRINSLSKLLINKLLSLSPELLQIFKIINPTFEEFMHYSYEVRNLHTHQSGIASKRFIKKCMDYQNENLIEIYSNNEPVSYSINCINGGYFLQEGQYISVKGIAPFLRAYSKDIAFVLDCYFKSKNNQ